MQPEDAQEELAEGVEHLNEEVPPEPHVRCEIRQQKTDTICSSQEVPRFYQKSRCSEERAAHHSQAERMYNGERPGVGCCLPLRGTSVIEQDEERWKEEDGMHTQVCREGDSKYERDACSLGSLSHGCEDEHVGDGRGRTGETCQDGEGVEEEAMALVSGQSL